MKMLISILVLLLTANCNQKENDLSFIEEYINKNNTDLRHKYISYSSESTKSTLDIYKYAYNYYLKKDTKRKDSIDENDKWPFTKEELSNLNIDNKRNTWKFGEAHSSLKIFNDFKGKTKKEIENFIRNKSQVITISKPIFNDQKTKAMFYYSKSIGVGSIVDTCVVILVKENDKWIVVGKAYSTEVY